MPFQHYLQSSIRYELTHEVILKCLFSDRDFLAFYRRQQADPCQISGRGKPVDLGLYDEDEKCICLIEIKMWSSLSKDQLERQTTALKERSCQGLHVLLGTSDLHYYKGEFDEITKLTNGFSSKIGYRELIDLLGKFITKSDAAEPIVGMADIYRDVLQNQYDNLQNAWLDLNPDRNKQRHYYSAYDKIRKYLLNESFSIYQVNNPSGGVYILNDNRSWFGFEYKEHAFELYQELLDGDFLIRIYSKAAPAWLRNEVQQRFINEFKETPQYSFGWSHGYRSSKWHKVTCYRPILKTEQDCAGVAALFKALNPVLKRIGQSIGSTDKQVA